MMSFGKTIINPLKGTKGFTLIEIVVVGVMVGILATIAIVNYVPLRRKALDTTALIDARNIVDAVTTAMLGGESVRYNNVPGTGGAIGYEDAAGNARTPVYVLSPGVKVIFMWGDSTQGDGSQTIFSATIYNENGTPDTSLGNLSGRKEYSCALDEAAGITSLP